VSPCHPVGVVLDDHLLEVGFRQGHYVRSLGVQGGSRDERRQRDGRDQRDHRGGGGASHDVRVGRAGGQRALKCVGCSYNLSLLPELTRHESPRPIRSVGVRRVSVIPSGAVQ